MKNLRTSVALAALLSIPPLVAMAQQVSVSSQDSSVKITGDLIRFDDETLVINTEIGELTLSRSATICEGQACPTALVTLDMAVSVVDLKTATLVQKLVSGFASERDLLGLSVQGANGVVESVGLITRAENEPAGRVAIATTNQTEAFNLLSSGQSALTFTTAPVSTAIADAILAEGGQDLRDIKQEQVVALDALVPIVHPDNPIRSVSLEELALIASGRLRNWSEIGGDNKPIRLLAPSEDTPLGKAFGALVLEPERARLRRTIEQFATEAEAAAVVSGDVTAISVVRLSETAENAILPIRQTCGPLAYASDFAIKAEEYPLSRRVYAYASGRPTSADQRQFNDFIASAGAQPFIQQAGYVDQSILAQPISLQGTRMTSAILSADTSATLELVQNLSRDLATADRLSTTFRFTSGSSRLDSKSVVDIQRMVDFLNSPRVRNREILIIGFTDDVGRFDLNERLALLRATNVRDALVGALGGDVLAGRMTVTSYGPLAPVGCNETADGRESNRRVEIWLR